MDKQLSLQLTGTGNRTRKTMPLIIVNTIRQPLLFISKRSQALQSNSKRWKATIRKINKFLVANRGEIACRVMRTAKKLGVQTVAVYSEADENALHVEMADEAYNIGPSAASQSYLRGDKLLEIAKRSKSQAIHPGYGFLSENVEFAESCHKNDIIFIGPPPSAIRDMGIKSTSKAIMSKAGVPIIEGYHGEDQNLETLANEAKRIGFPVMIKAVRGGGGKGMRIALSESDFKEALESAKTESDKAFGDSVVLLEKFVAEPRHVEVQIFADQYGNAVHLFERDCSVQRRHQKIIEEAPAPGLSEKLRSELGAAAVRAAKAVGYIGAGTVEFILDRNSHSFHFMEMNTRLQVEHPITEMITGTDLVEWQIKIASGEELPVTQEDVSLKGHAFEARIYAEDSRGGLFLPCAGPLLHLQTPSANADVRIETGVREGDEVPVHYDPMIAKLVVWGKSRSEALSKLQHNLLQYNIAGVPTNINFLLDLSKHPEFIEGNVHTNFIKDHFDSLFKSETLKEEHLVQAALATVLHERKFDEILKNNQFDPFIIESNFRVNYYQERCIKLKHDDKDINVKIKFITPEDFEIIIQDEDKKTIAANAVLQVINNKHLIKCTIDGFKSTFKIYKNDDILAIFDNDGRTEFSLEKSTIKEESLLSTGPVHKAVAPMPGVLDRMLVKAGDVVKKGDSLFVLIAMKMEHVVKANNDTKIADVLFKAGDYVAKDATVVTFEESPTH